MKRIVLILILFPLLSRSQISHYQPLLDSINRWTFAIDFLPVFPENILSNCNYPYAAEMGSTMETQGDTIINSHTYLNLEDNYRGCRFGYIREDTASKKVYFLDNSFNLENIIYDFNMQTGDSLMLTFYSQPSIAYWKSGYYRLDSVNTVNILSVNRKIFYLNCHSCINSHTLPWIEGIGNQAHPVYTFCDNFNDPNWGNTIYNCGFPHPLNGCWVTCFDHQNKIYYDSCAYYTTAHHDSCHYIIEGSVAELNFSTSVKISLNPFHEKTEIRILDESILHPKLVIYDYSGRGVSFQKIYNNKITINRSLMSNGVYLYRLIDKKGRYAVGKLIVE